MNLFVFGGKYIAYRTKEFLRYAVNDARFNVYYNGFESLGIRKIISRLASLAALLCADMVYVTPYERRSVLFKFALLLKKPLICDFYLSLYATDILDRKLYSPDSKQARKYKKADLAAVKRSARLFFLTESEAKYFLSLLGEDADKIKHDTVPLVIPEKPAAVLPYFSGARDYIHFCWCGTYIPLHGLEKIILAAEIAKNKGLNFRITFWGDSGEKAADAIRAACDLRLGDTVTFVNDKWGDIETWENFIAQNCDVTFGIFGDSDKARTVLANKTVDGVAFRTPVITARTPGAKEFFDEQDLFFCGNTPESIAETMISAASKTKSEIDAMVSRAYDKYLKFFTPAAFWRKTSGIILDEWEEITSRGK